MADGKVPRIAIIGAGAVGGYYGGRLAQHGHDVHFLLRSDFDEVSRRGWKIMSRDGDFDLKPGQFHAYHDAHNMPPADWVIVTLKSTANDLFGPTIGPLIKENTAILTLQNGLGNEETLAALFGAPRVIGGMAFVCINRVAPGVIDHTDHGVIRMGLFDLEGTSTGSPAAAAMPAMSDAFNASGIHCEILSDLRRGRWQKLVWNIPFNGLSAALDQTTDQILATPAGERMVRQIMGEVVATAAALGSELPPEIIDRNIANTRSMGAYRTSMHIDRKMGRPLEVEAILGRPLESARCAGVPTPALETLYYLVKMVNPARV